MKLRDHPTSWIMISIGFMIVVVLATNASDHKTHITSGYLLFNEPLKNCAGLTFGNDGIPFTHEEKKSLVDRFYKIGVQTCLMMHNCKKCEPIKFEVK